MVQKFELKEEHLELLRKAYIRWEDCEFGAPAIDCKRPYGNSDVYGDIAEILGIEPSPACGVEFVEDQIQLMDKFHQETKTALQVILVTGKFEIGLYEADDYYENWRKVK